MQGQQPRRGTAQALNVRLGLCDQRGILRRMDRRVVRGERCQILPEGDGPEPFIRCEQLLQKRRARARQTDDDDRCFDRLVQYLGLPLPEVDEAQALHKMIEDLPMKVATSDRAEVQFVLDRRAQLVERFTKVVVAEVIKTGGFSGGFQKTLRFEGPSRFGGISQPLVRGSQAFWYLGAGKRLSDWRQGIKFSACCFQHSRSPLKAILSDLCGAGQAAA